MTLKMTPTYTYTNSADFINSLAFDHIETYSFQRGIGFEEKREKIQIEYDKLGAKKSNKNDLTIEEEQRFNELRELVGYTQYLINEKGQFHWSSKKINTFNNNNPIVGAIKEILLIEAVAIPRWLCAPVYRDGIVFYDKGNKIVSTLNVCLSCQYMETKKFDHVNADNKTYDLLKKLFIDIGHDVETD
jgi:hypothetical protein